MSQDVVTAVRHGDRVSPLASEVLDAIAELHGIVMQIKGGGVEGSHSDSIQMTVADDCVATQVVDRLQRCEAIEAAYLKPPDELPA